MMVQCYCYTSGCLGFLRKLCILIGFNEIQLANSVEIINKYIMQDSRLWESVFISIFVCFYLFSNCTQRIYWHFLFYPYFIYAVTKYSPKSWKQRKKVRVKMRKLGALIPSLRLPVFLILSPAVCWGWTWTNCSSWAPPCLNERRVQKSCCYIFFFRKIDFFVPSFKRFLKNDSP